MTNIVTTDDTSPRAPADRCSHCGQPLGSNHTFECPCNTRRVKVRYSYEIEIEVPAHWDQGNIEFAKNDGTWCADNGVDEIAEFANRLEKESGGCTCDHFTCEYLGEVMDGEAEIVEPEKPALPSR